MAGAASTARRTKRRPQRRPASGASAARTRRRRFPRLWRPRPGMLVLLLVLVASLGGFGAWALYGSTWFRVEHVSVSWTGGPEVLDAQEVLDVAAVPKGVPMAALDKGAIRERVADRLPRVREVEVVRAWPEGVGLKITEREAEVLLPEGDAFVEIDADGTAFSELPEATEGVPLLAVELDSESSVNRFGEERIRNGAVSVVSALPPEVREETRVVRVRSWDAIELELSDGRTVLWGSPDDPSAKATALGAVLKAVPDARHFDVSVPSAPAAAQG